MISIALPIHNMKDKDYFLARVMKSIERQTYKDYEVVITDKGKMAENTNAAIKRCKGDIIKILYLDDYFSSPNSLQRIADEFKGGWLASGCIHDDVIHKYNEHYPTFDDRIFRGINTIGSPSVVAFENKEPLLFDENLSWMLDIDLYARLFDRYGMPTILNEVNVVIGVGDHQTTHILTDQEKQNEVKYYLDK